MRQFTHLVATGVFITGCLLNSVNAMAKEDPVAQRERLARQAAAILKASQRNDEVQNTLLQHSEGLSFASFLAASGRPLSNEALASQELETAEVWLQRGQDDGYPSYVAFRPAGNEESWTAVPAFDLDGNLVNLDVDQAPLESVLVVENRGGLAMIYNVEKANELLREMGLQYRAPIMPTSSGSGTFTETIQASSVDTTRLDRIRLSDDMEPWISGKAEVYAITAGVFDFNNANIQIIGMPYLDHDDTTYYPRQILLNWNDYAYAAANILLYEQDDNTNYQDLVVVLVNAVGQLGSLAGLPELTAIAQITSTIIQAIPSSFFSNDDDFVDAYYTIERRKNYYGLRGAGNNANSDFVHFLLQAN